jgi:hypothetical protein
LQRGHRGEEDDASTATRPEALAEPVREDEWTAHIHVDLFDVDVDVEAPERPDGGERGVVDEQSDVDARQVTEDAVEVTALRQVGLQSTCLDARRGGDVGGDLLCELDTSSDEDDVQTAGRATTSKGLTEAFRGSGDDGPRAVTLGERLRSHQSSAFVVTGRVNGCSRHMRTNIQMGTRIQAAFVPNTNGRWSLARGPATSSARMIVTVEIITAAQMMHQLRIHSLPFQNAYSAAM